MGLPHFEPRFRDIAAGDIGSNDRDELPFDLLPERSG
jgi:hypothetical protein